MDSLGKKISALRRERKLSQEELASALFVSRQSVSKWETGQSIPDADNIAAMCSFFGVSADTLIFGGSASEAAVTSAETAAPCALCEEESAQPEKKPQKKLWLKILVISLVLFFAFIGLMAIITFVFMLTVEQDRIIWTRVVPMICVMAVAIFAIVTGVVIALTKKNKKPRK